MLEKIQLLRAETGAGIMECKSALLKAEGDTTRAMSLLMEKGFQLVQKKAERAVESGVSYAEVVQGRAILLHVRCETPFVAANPKFLELSGVIARAAGHPSVTNVSQLMQMPTEQPNSSVQDVLQKMIMMFRENIVLQDVQVIEGAFPYAYMHLKGRVGVVLTLMENQATKDVNQFVAKELALQIASMSPAVIRQEELSSQELEAIQHEIDHEMTLDPTYQGKPDQVLARIRQGKLEKQLRQRCLLEQPYIRDDSIRVRQFLKQQEKLHQTTFEILRFIRHEQVVDLENAACCATMRF